uniref:CS domain-containing protein n=1 Tax=Timema monikensis TaxID=170555 RepID=A0A7R9HME1_9NEOP|nr:unnamed protein product [Timema monikensis]
MPEVLSPFVYWAQTESNLTLKVDLKDVKNPYVQLENKKLQFGAQGYGARGLNKYAFTLDFHSAIDPEESHYKVYDRNVDFTLKKKESGWWPRITGMPQKPAWLKIDFDRWKSEEDVEDDDESRDIMEDYPNMYNKLEKEELGYKRDECQPFLQRFQTSKPMTPYLFEAVEKLLRYLMNRCVKPDLMKCTGPKLLSIDTKKSENLILSKNIDIGFATKRLLGETAITVTERQKLEFIHECRSMLTTMIAKLQEKSPLKQKAVRGLSSLDPCVIQHSPQLAQKRFSFLLEELNHANIINDVLAENAKKEYLHFCNLKKSELQEIFRPCDQFSDEVGLDTIYGSFLIGEANYKHLWEVIKICLVLSHGNATVEGGFSVNKSLLVENMHEKTVIAQRHIHDEIQEAGGIKNIHISKKMLDYVRGARKRYHEYLEMKKQEKSEKDKKKAEKRKLDIQVKDLEGERKKLMMATEEKREAIDVELQELKKKQASLY